MSKNEDEERRLRREKIELLKLKQGIISESEIIPQDKAEKPKMTLPQKIGAFLDLNKGFIAMGAVAAAIIAGIFFMLFSREPEDIMVLVVITDENSALKQHSEDIEKALEMYCPDFDNNGSVHVGISVADISADAQGDALRAQNDMLSLEMDTRHRQLIISDGGFMSYIKGSFGDNAKVIMESEPSGVPLNSTHFAENAGVGDCSDDVKFFIRGEMKGDSKTATVQRERAIELVKNIIENKAVNI